MKTINSLIKDYEFSWIYERGPNYVIRPSLINLRKELCSNGEFGPVFQVFGAWDQKIQDRFESSGLENLFIIEDYLRPGASKEPYELEFLRKLKSVKALLLRVILEDAEPIYEMPQLMQLGGADERGKILDWSRFPNIVSCFIGWGPMTHTLANCKKLRTLSLWTTGYTCKELPDFLASLDNLEELTLDRFSSISTIDFLAQLPKLKRLDIHQATSVSDFSPLQRCNELTSLEISCAKFHDLSVVSSCQKLENLMLGGKGVDSVKPLANHPTLQYLALDEGASILDGDLYPLETIPNLEHVNIRMPSRRHYSHHFDRDTGAMIPKPDWKPI